MADIYIAPTGNDTTGDGSTGNPYLTLAKAVTMASASDTIKVKEGTYTVADTVAVSLSGLIIESEDQDASKVTFKTSTTGNFVIQLNNQVTAPQLRYVTVEARFGVVMRRNFTSGADVVVHHCHIHPGNDTSDTQTGIQTLGNYGNNDFYIYNNYIHNYAASSGYGIDTVNSGWNSDNIIIKNNIITGCGKGIYISPNLASFTEDYNCFDDNTSDLWGYADGEWKEFDKTAHDIVDDPDTDVDGKITTASPCYDTGVVASPYTDGYSGTAPDIGWYEATAGTLTPRCWGNVLAYK